ncbi:MAG: HPF/RaiA family ribosome-associated protein [Geminicoccaceae bacterium]|nr:MAG: HPF/RaiA family ribosome-associated protein [Geminicoccaceae bacterium]
MQKPLEIVFRHMAPSPALEARVREKVEGLERFAPRIIGCRVVVEREQRRHRKGDLFRVGVDVTVPGHEIAVTRTGPQNQAHEDVYVALRDAFDATVRRLQDAVRQVRGRVKHHEAPLTGKVVRLFADYGFVETAAGDVYFHQNAVANDGFAKLEVGTEVRLEVAEDESPHGWQATTVAATGV